MRVGLDIQYICIGGATQHTLLDTKELPDPCLGQRKVSGMYLHKSGAVHASDMLACCEIMEPRDVHNAYKRQKRMAERLTMYCTPPLTTCKSDATPIHKQQFVGMVESMAPCPPFSGVDACWYAHEHTRKRRMHIAGFTLEDEIMQEYEFQGWVRDMQMGDAGMGSCDVDDEIIKKRSMQLIFTYPEEVVTGIHQIENLHRLMRLVKSALTCGFLFECSDFVDTCSQICMPFENDMFL